MSAKKKTVTRKLMELLFPRDCEDRRKFRIAMAKNRQSAARLQRGVRAYSEAVK